MNILPDLPDDWQHDDIRRVMLKHFPPGTKPRTALDCGAHRGIVARLLLDYFQEVVCFEPTDLFDQLPVEARKFQVALGAHTMSRCFMQPGTENNGQTHVVLGKGDTVLTSLDRVDGTNGLHNVDFIKLDVEGMEKHVLVGGYELIQRDKPVIMFEENGLSERYGVPRGGVAALLREWGYVCSMVIRKSAGTTEEVYAWPK